MQIRYLIAVFNIVECQNEEVTLRLGVLFSSVQFYLISVWSKYKNTKVNPLHAVGFRDLPTVATEHFSGMATK